MSIFSSLDTIDQVDEKIDLSNNKSLNITFSTVEYSYKTFLKKLQEQTITDAQVEYELSVHYQNYCNYDNFQNPDTRKIFQSIWTNEQFLRILLKVVIEKKTIKQEIQRFYNKSICKICYDYYTEIGKNNLEDKLLPYMFRIVENINYNKILPMTIYMERIHALFIVMAKYSSFNYEQCVTRVNEFIMRLGYDFTRDNIVDIYYRLYGDESFSLVFNYTMTQTYELDKLNQAELAMYHRINNCLLSIINSMPSPEISKMLRSYSNYLEITNKDLRFDIKTVSDNYNRLKFVLNQLILDGMRFR